MIVHGSVESLDKLGELAGRTGTTVDFFASLRHAAAQSDVDNEQFASSLDKLNKQLGDMTVGKGGEFLKFLNEVGPGLATQVKGAKSTEQAISFLTDAFAKIGDPQRRATLAAHAFGKSNLQMGEFLHQGSAAIQAQQRRFLELAGSQDEAARRAGEFDNAARETATAVEGLRTAVVAGLLPALTTISGVVTKFLVQNREGLAKWAEDTGKKIQAWVDGGGMQRLGETLGKVADGVGRVVQWLGPMGVAAVAATVLLAPLAMSVVSLGVALIGATPALIALGAVLLPLAPVALAVAGAGSALALVGYEIYSSWDKLSAKFQEVGDTLRWSIVDAWAEVRPILSALSVLPGFGALRSVGDFVAGQTAQAIEARTGQSVDSIRARNLEAARPRMSGGDSRISVDFTNLPRGVRVSQDQNSSQPVDMSVGPAMVSP